MPDALMASYLATAALIVPLVSMIVSGPAAAADTAPPTEAAVPATETRETLIPKLRLGDDDGYLEFYGQINKGVLVFDDGGSTLGYFPVDNGNSSSRAGLRLYTVLYEGWSFGGNLEWEWNPYSTTNVNQLNRDDFDWETDLLRKAEVYLESENFGKLWLGQGSMASDATAEVDLSGTVVVGYSLVSDMAGGPFFRLDDGDLSSVHVKDAFTNFDGLGRKLRVRYDTPKFAGFSLATSVGDAGGSGRNRHHRLGHCRAIRQHVRRLQGRRRCRLFRACRGRLALRWIGFVSA